MESVSALQNALCCRQVRPQSRRISDPSTCLLLEESRMSLRSAVDTHLAEPWEIQPWRADGRSKGGASRGVTVRFRSSSHRPAHHQVTVYLGGNRRRSFWRASIRLFAERKDPSGERSPHHSVCCSTRRLKSTRRRQTPDLNRSHRPPSTSPKPFTPPVRVRSPRLRYLLDSKAAHHARFPGERSDRTRPIEPDPYRPEPLGVIRSA